MSGVLPADLAEHAFLRGLSADRLDRLASLATSAEMPAGQRIFEEGEHASRLWLIRAGRVVLDLRVPGRRRLVNGQVAVPGGGQLKGPTPRVDHFLFRVVPPRARAWRMRYESPAVTTTFA